MLLESRSSPLYGGMRRVVLALPPAFDRAAFAVISPFGVRRLGVLAGSSGLDFRRIKESWRRRVRRDSLTNLIMDLHELSSIVDAKASLQSVGCLFHAGCSTLRERLPNVRAANRMPYKVIPLGFSADACRESLSR